MNLSVGIKVKLCMAFVPAILTLHCHTRSIDVPRHIVSWSDNGLIYFHLIKIVVGNDFSHILVTN